MKKVCVLLAEGFEEIEALTVVDLLRRARIYVDTAAVADEYMVRGSHGIAVQTEDLFSEVDFEDFDMLVLPGGLPGTTNLGDHSGVRKAWIHIMPRQLSTGRVSSLRSWAVAKLLPGLQMYMHR